MRKLDDVPATNTLQAYTPFRNTECVRPLTVATKQQIRKSSDNICNAAPTVGILLHKVLC